MSSDLINNGQLRLMVASDLQCVLKLRNHPDIKRYMFTQHEISLREHTLWFERASNNQGIRLLVFYIDKKCMAFVQLKKTSDPGVANWGFYVAPDAPKGVGKKVGNEALFRAFEIENYHKICGQVFKFNKPSINFHKSLGFSQESISQEKHFIDKDYRDLINFGLLKSKWNKFKNIKE